MLHNNFILENTITEGKKLPHEFRVQQMVTKMPIYHCGDLLYSFSPLGAMTLWEVCIAGDNVSSRLNMLVSPTKAEF